MKALALAIGTAATAAVGAIAYHSTLLWHQRRAARMWRVIRLYVPPGTETNPERLKAFLTALWGKFRRAPLSALLYGQPRVAFEVNAGPAGMHYNWVVPADEAKFVRQLLQTCMPGAELDEAEDYLSPTPPAGKALATTEIRLQRHAAFPLSDFNRIFAESLQGVLVGCRGQGEITVHVLLCPVRDAVWKQGARSELLRAEGKVPVGYATIDAVSGAIKGLFDTVNGNQAGKDAAAKPLVSRLERAATKDTPAKLLAPGFDVQIRVMVAAGNRREARTLASRVSALFAALNGANHLMTRSYGLFPHPRAVWPSWSRRMGPVRPGAMILTPEELSSLINPAPPEPPRADQVRLIELRRPPLAEGIHVCDALYRSQRVAVRMRPEDLDTHLGIQGKSGNGKGVLQEHLFREIARLGMGGIYLDPLGGSVRKLLGSLPDSRLDDVIYIEAGNPDWAMPLNFLAGVDGDEENTAADAVNLYFRLWGDAWGKSTEEMLRAATIAVIESGGALPEAELVLSDPGYRQSILPRVKSGPIRHFLQNLPDKVTENMRAPLNKLHELLWQPSILCLVGQTDSLDWCRIILEKRLVLVNLNKGNPKIGSMGASLVSGIVWSRIGRAGLSIPVPQRVRFVQVADEIKDVASRTPEDFETAFSQYRQFLLPVVAAGQYPRQLPDKVINAMTGNIGSKLVLREDQPHSKDCIEFLGASDVLEETDLNNLPKLTGFANLVIEDRPTGVFTAWAPPFSRQIRDPDEAALRSFKRWAKPRPEVLAAINKRIQAATGGNAPPQLD